MRIIIQMNQIIPLSKRTILGAVLTLDNEGYKVTAKGLCLVLIGDKRIKDLAESNVFGYLPSVTSKKLKSRIRYLINLDYLKLDYDLSLDVHFLTLTAKCDDLNLKPLKKKSPKKEKEEVYYIYKDEFLAKKK